MLRGDGLKQGTEFSCDDDDNCIYFTNNLSLINTNGMHV
jgi:hypothetical protein